VVILSSMKVISLYVRPVVIIHNICAKLPNRDTGQSQIYGCSSKINVKLHQSVPCYLTLVIFRNKSVASLTLPLHPSQIYQQTFLLFPCLPSADRRPLYSSRSVSFNVYLVTSNRKALVLSVLYHWCSY
jgi:hypothetical protein